MYLLADVAISVRSAGYHANTVNLYGFLPVLRENVSTSRFSAKVKSFPEKLRFSFSQVITLVLRWESCSLQVMKAGRSTVRVFVVFLVK